MYSLDCSYFDKVFNSLDNLVEYCQISGMDPNYEITKDGKKIGENLIDYLIDERQFGELRDARKEYRSLLSLSPALKSLESRRRAFRKEIKRIEENRSIDDERKKELIKQIFDKEEKLLTLFLKRADRILRKD